MDSGISILIVEDESIIAYDIKCTLESMGYLEVKTASSGEEVLLSIAQSKPAIIFMDIGLGGELDGIETAEEINKEYGEIPIIFLTSYSNSKIKDRASKTPHSCYLLKPFEPDLLNSTIKETLHLK